MIYEKDSTASVDYSPDGTFISSSEIKDRGFQSYILDGGILSYYGYGNGRKFRLSYIKGDNVRNLLATKAIVPNFLNMAPAFSKTADGGVAIVDSYNPVICKFKSGKIEPYLKFDFGKYSIPEAFFKYEDPFKASKFLSSNDYALIGRYFENAKYKFAEIAIETKDETEAGFSYGINSDGVWKWFYAGKAGKDPFAASFRTIDDHNTLFCIIDPALADKIPPALMKKVSNPDILQNIKKDDNYIIAKIYLL
ncbi:MAG: hypothetical protein LKI59_05570 [Bacteroidales bacterium]|nr:hypothetical protein [Bacteroidales bacterium]